MRIALLLVLLAACGSAIGNYDYAKEPDPRTREIVLGVGDVVSINVWDQKDLNTEATIRPDGKITMPLVGDLQAAGVTPSALTGQIKGALTNFLKGGGTSVTVAVKAWRSYRFTIEGEVQKPGVFNPDQYLRITDAIAMASGITRFGKRDGMVLMRTDPKTGQIRRIPLDYDQLASGRRPDMNIYVLPGDLIYVP